MLYPHIQPRTFTAISSNKQSVELLYSLALELQESGPSMRIQYNQPDVTDYGGRCIS